MYLRNMSFDQDTAAQKAKQDLANRLSINEQDIDSVSVDEKEFPDMSLGAPVEGEMSAQMISSGWEIKLNAASKNYEYRADKYQLRLVDYEGTNHIIAS